MPPRAELPVRALPWACVVAVVGWLGVVALRFPHADGDLLWQRWLGERILREHAIPRALGAETFGAPGAPWTPHEWLFSVALAWSGDRGAPWLLALACALAVAVALTTVVIRCRRRGVSDIATSAGILASGLAMIQAYGVRGQVLGWAALATVVTLLESEGPWAWAAIPLTAGWANLHASAFLAPAIAAAFAFSALLRDRRVSPAVVRAAALSAGCALATLATPFGVDLARYAAGLLASPIRHSIAEWGPTSMASASFVLGALPLLLVLATFGTRASLRDRVLAIAMTLMLFSAVRNVPVFALVAAPIALSALPSLRASRPAAFGGVALRWAVPLIVVLCGGAISALTWFDAPPPGAVLPIATSRALLAQARAEPRVFCEDFAWCSIFLGAPARFFMDGRCDPYPPGVWRDYREVIDGNRGWDAILEREHVDAVLVRRNGALDSLLAERPGRWRLLASDPVAGLYVRPALLADAHR